MRKEIKKNGISRRDFLKGVSAGLASVGVASMGLAGCASTATTDSTVPNSTATPETTGASTPTVTVSPSWIPNVEDFDVINTDVLILGGGNTGVYAAQRAAKEGRSVALVDKGVFRHNGVSGMNWEHGNKPTILKMVPNYDVLGALVVNSEAAVNALNLLGDEMFLEEINQGQTIALRKEDGTIDNFHCQFVRHHMDDAASKDAIQVFDRTLITDIFVSNGKCYGAMGIYLPTGKFTVFRSNATVDCTGGCVWMYGWLTVSAYSIATADNTGDVEAALYRKGVGIINSEFCEFDLEMLYPYGLGCGFGSVINIDAREPEQVFGADKKPLMPDYDNSTYSRERFTQAMAKAIHADKRGTDLGGALIQLTEDNIAHGRPVNKRNAEFLKEKYGIDLFSDLVEAAPEMYEKGGVAYFDENQMTEIPGLFMGHNYRGGGSLNTNLFSGRYAGHCAAEYAASLDITEDIDWTDVIAEYQRLHEIRTRKVENGLRPHQIRQAIQKVAFQSLGMYRTTAGLESAIAELRRIQKEDMPRMILEDSSPIYSKEWKEAIENYNMLDNALLTAEAALRREETRGYCVRAEFPAADNENWNCWLEGRLVDGELSFQKIYPPKMDSSKILI